MTSSDGIAYRAEYERLTKELKSHPGIKADKMMQDVQRTFRTWYQRSQELRALLHHGETDDDMQSELMQNVRPPIAREQYVGALDSTLNAYLSAMVTLIDVSRRISEKLPETFQTDYADRSRVARAVDGIVVIRDLRNYMLHYGSAPWHFSGTADANGMTTRIGLDSETLKEWKKWKVDSRTYLGAHEVVHLSKIITPYEVTMVDLFEWFSEDFFKYKQPDIDAANDLARRVNLHMTGGVSDGSDRQQRMAHIQENIRRAKAGEPQINYVTGQPFPG